MFLKRCSGGRPEYGHQSRNVTCVSRCPNGHLAPSTAPCDHFQPRTSSVRPCKLPCPEDCIVSDFSHWSVCPVCPGCLSPSVGSSTTHTGYSCSNQTRHRAVLSVPFRGGVVCRDRMMETRPCPSPTETKEGGICGGGRVLKEGYRYRLGRWAECLHLREDDRRRAQKPFSGLFPPLGQTWRPVQCIDLRGKPVEIG